jgi:dienelactone hydrolase
MARNGVVRAAWAAAVLALAVACGEGPGGPDRAASGTTSPTNDASEAAYDSGTWQTIKGPLGRCGPQPPRVADQRFDTFTLRGPGQVMPAVLAGHGRTVVVLLHQTDGNGFCSWLDFAQRIATVPGQTALAFDLCGYGKARCRGDNTTLAPQVAQVRRAIDEAERLGARRVVLVGASMGGSLAVLAAARDSRVDAVVDLSGPDEWRGGVLHEAAARLHVPVLVAMADSEGPEVVATAQATAEAGPDGSEFVGAEGGHGYLLLQESDGRPTPLSDRVLARISG